MAGSPPAQWRQQRRCKSRTRRCTVGAQPPAARARANRGAHRPAEYHIATDAYRTAAMAPAALLLALLAAAPAAAAPPLGAADALRSKQLRLLAFGDSITEGWINSSRRKTPYTWSLEAALRRRLGPKGVDVQVTNAGETPLRSTCTACCHARTRSVTITQRSLLADIVTSSLRTPTHARPHTHTAIGGKGVLDALNDAWYSQLSAARGAKRPYQFIVFMAGINDILIQ